MRKAVIQICSSRYDYLKVAFKHEDLGCCCFTRYMMDLEICGGEIMVNSELATIVGVVYGLLSS